MECVCTTIQYLTKLSVIEATEASGGRSGIAASALKIISDMNEYALTADNIKYLHWLIDSIYKQGHGVLLDHLHEGAPDCKICEAMAERMTVQSRTINLGN